MLGIVPSAWRLLLVALHDGGYRPLAHSEFRTAGVDPAALIQQGVLSRTPAGAWVPPGCLHACIPNTDFDSRASEALVGLACPYEEQCWSRWKWIPAEDTEFFEIAIPGFAAVLRQANGLEPMEATMPKGVVPLGRLKARGMSAPVILMERAEVSELLCRGLREQLKAHHLIAIVRGRQEVVRVADGVAISDIPVTDTGDLQLGRALDLLNPGFRERAARDPLAVYDDVRIEFAHVERKQHLVRINGGVVAGFARSDLKFLRLLLLAAHRRAAPRDEDGWVGKHHLEGDEKDHDLEGIRGALGEWKHLIKVQRAGPLRLAVSRHSIYFDATLAGFQPIMGLKGAPKSRHTRGKSTHHKDLLRGLKTAERLLGKARQMGVPTGESTRTGEESS